MRYSVVLNTYGEYNTSYLGGACGEIVIVIGNEHGDTSSNHGRD